jgi:hypothetical protein
MARQQNGDGLSQAEAAVPNTADMYEMRYFKGGRWQKQNLPLIQRGAVRRLNVG